MIIFLTVLMALYLQVNNEIEPSPHNKECYLYAVDSQASVVFASIQYAIPPESATIWTKSLFQAIRPERYVTIWIQGFRM